MTDSLRFLILEDNPADVELLRFELEEAGFLFTPNVVMTETDFIRELQEFSPDLILSDYDLPRYNGALALAEARRRCPDIPFILVTGAVTEDRAIEILTQGAKDYVLKTRLQQKLGPAVVRALAEAEEHRARKHAEAQLREAYLTLERQVEERTSELQESKEHLSVALKSSEMGIFEWDIIENRRYFDDHVYLLLGIKPETFSGAAEEFFRVLHPDDRQAVQNALNKAIDQGGHYETEYRVIWPDGSIHHLSARGNVSRDNAGRPVRMIGACWDITEQKLAELELKKRTLQLEAVNRKLEISLRFQEIANRKKDLQQLLDAFVGEIRTITGCEAVGIRLRDESGNIPYCAYQGFSQKFYETESPLSLKTDHCMCINVVMGTTDPTLPFYTEGGSFYMNGTTRFLATVSEEDKGRTRNVCNQTGYESVALIPIRVDSRIRGLIHLADRRENMVPLETVRIFEQVAAALGVGAQRALAETELHRQHEWLQVTLASIGDAVIAADAKGRITFMNTVAETLTGWTFSDALSRPVAEVFNILNEHTRQAVESPVIKVLKEGAVVGLANHTILVRRDGTEVPIDDSGAPIRDADGTILGVVLVFRDITERKRSEEMLQAHRQLLETVVNHLPVAANIIRGSDLRSQLINPAYQAIAPGKEMVGKTLEELWPETGQQFGELCRQVLATGEPYFCVNEPNMIRRRPDGPVEKAYFSWSLFRVHLPGDEGWGILNTAWETTERKETEDTLKASEERYRLLAETMLQGVVHQDAGGRVIAMNPAAERILGKSREEFISGGSGQGEHDPIRGNGEPFPRVEHPSMVSLRTGLPVHGVVMGVFNPKLGDYRWISIDAVPVFRPGETGPSEVYTVFEDITDRKQIEDVQAFLAKTSSGTQDEPFFDSLARFLAQKLGMDFICIDRLEGDGLMARTVAVWCDGRFEDNVTYALKDTPCGDVVGKTVCCFPASVCQFFPADQVLRDLRAESYVGVTLFGKGGQPIGLIAVIGRRPLANRPLAEATLRLLAARAAEEMERLEADEALRESEEKFRALFESNLNGVALHEIILDELGNPVDYVFLQANPAFEKHTGIPLVDILGKRATQAIPGIEKSGLIQIYGKVAISGEPTAFETFFEPLQRYYNISVYRVGEGRFAVVFEDITGRKRMDKVLEERSRQLEEANRELESFSYSVSHDLKAPLRAIEGFSRMLMKKYKSTLDEGAVRLIDVIHGETGKMGALIDALLSFSRMLKSSMVLSEIDMEALAGEICNDLRAAHKERQLEFKVANLPTGCGDRTLIRQVLFNLLSNAVKFTKNRAPGIIEMSSHREPGRVVYQVKDNGVGFNMAYYNKLFGVFQRLHDPEQYEGTGVGLAIVQRIINRHGGRIWAEGKEDEGATFFFTLPENRD